MKRFCLLISLVAFLPVFSARAQDVPKILSMQDRAELRDAWLEQRLATVLPGLMTREAIDMWVIVAREYNEDPVIKTMLPAKWHAARRRTILVFFDKGEQVERLAVARYDIGDFFKKAWDKEKQPDQLARLAEIIRERDPKKIAINYSRDFALADGITYSEYTALMEALPQKLQERIVSGERLAIGWLETRTPEELSVYSSICRIAHEVIHAGFSDNTIQPGFTTTSDVEWWFRERIRELKLTTWFHPSVSVQRATEPGRSGSFASKPESMTIERGDLLHVDFGITYLGLNTDTQQHAYVLKPDERDAPAGLKKALQAGNRLQDILTSQFEYGRTGNEILAAALKQAKEEGLKPSIYTHPLGFHGHAAGPTIGLWDQQEGVPGKGDYELYYDTVHSIELNVTTTIPEWESKEIRIMLEEDAVFTKSGVRYLDGRQTELILIP